MAERRLERGVRNGAQSSAPRTVGGLVRAERLGEHAVECELEDVVLGGHAIVEGHRCGAELELRACACSIRPARRSPSVRPRSR